MKCVHCSLITMKAEKMGPEEDGLDAQSLQMTILHVCLHVAHFLFDWSVQHDFVFLFFLFNPPLVLEVTVMPDFLISQRTFVLTQQFMSGCVRSGSILVIVNTVLLFRLWLFSVTT